MLTLVPIREIIVGGTRKYIPLIAIDEQAVKDYGNVYPLIKSNLDKLDDIFSLHTVRPLRVDNLKDTIDAHGHVYRTHIMPIGRSKLSVDNAFNIDIREMLRIIYVPVYRLSFNDKKQSTYACFGDNDLTGFCINKPIASEYQESSDANAPMRNGCMSACGLTPVTLIIAAIAAFIIMMLDSDVSFNFSFILSFILCTVILAAGLFFLIFLFIVLATSLLGMNPIRNHKKNRRRRYVIKCFS